MNTLRLSLPCVRRYEGIKNNDISAETTVRSNKNPLPPEMEVHYQHRHLYHCFSSPVLAHRSQDRLSSKMNEKNILSGIY